jgi:hypothetical protein
VTDFILVSAGAVLLAGLSLIAGAMYPESVRRLLMPIVGTHGFPARAVWTSARRMPQGLETPAAAGGAPGLVQPGASRFACCEHCDNGSSCNPADNHLAGCAEGCNDPVPVLGDRMLSEVSREHDLLTDAEIAALKPPRRPVNGRWLPDQPLIASSEHPPWMTAPMAIVPPDERGWPYTDPGDGIDVPVALVRPYAPKVTGPLGVADPGGAGERPFAERVRPS